MLHGITRNFPTENEEDIFDKKVTILSRFITQRVFHIPEIHYCQDTRPNSQISIGHCKGHCSGRKTSHTHAQIVNKFDSYDYSQTQS